MDGNRKFDVDIRNSRMQLIERVLGLDITWRGWRQRPDLNQPASKNTATETA